MLEDRKDIILGLLHAPGREGDNEPIDGITRMEKLVFLARNWDVLRPQVEEFEFEPDNFGPFSDILQDDLESLRTMGLVETLEAGSEKGADEYVSQKHSAEGEYSRPTRYRLTSAGEAVARQLLADHDEAFEALSEIKSKFNAMSLDRLLSFVYNSVDEEWLEESVVKDRYRQA